MKEGEGETKTGKAGEGRAGQFVARLEHVSKTLPGGRALFGDVSLALLAGAKVSSEERRGRSGNGREWEGEGGSVGGKASGWESSERERQR